MAMNQGSKNGHALSVGGKAYSHSPVKYSDTRQMWASASSCAKEDGLFFPLHLCYATCDAARTAVCGCFASHVFTRLHTPFLVALV